MVKIEKGKRDKNNIEITVTVEQEKVQEEFNDTYRELSRKARIPGFRSGRIPINILEMNLGKDYINQQVAEKLIKDTYSDAIDNSKLEPINVPKVDIAQIENKKPFIYKMILELKPDIVIPDLKDISIEKKEPKVTEKEVDEDLERIRESHAKLRSIEDRESKIGDFLIVDYESFIDGKPIPDGKREKQMIQLGEKLPAEFNNNLIGVKPGDEKDIVMRVPDNVEDKKISGKEVTHHVSVSEIKEKDMPELDDDFAKSAGEYKNLNDLREHVRKQLIERAKYQADNEFKEDLMEKVAEKIQFEVPTVLIDKQVESMMNNLKKDLANRQMTLEDYYKAIKVDEEKVKKEYHSLAEKQIKKELIIDKIIQDGKIFATDEEVNKKIEEIAESTNQKPLKVRALLEKNNTLHNLKEQIKRDKAIDFLLKKVKVIEK